MATYRDLYEKYASQFGVDPNQLAAIGKVESSFNPMAQSPAGAMGVMQFMPQMAESMNIDPYNPQQSIQAAAKHYAYLMGKYKDPKLAQMAYNAGEPRVDSFLQGKGGPLAQETVQYPSRVSAAMPTALDEASQRQVEQIQGLVARGVDPDTARTMVTSRESFDMSVRGLQNIGLDLTSAATSLQQYMQGKALPKPGEFPPADYTWRGVAGIGRVPTRVTSALDKFPEQEPPTPIDTTGMTWLGGASPTAPPVQTQQGPPTVGGAPPSPSPSPDMMALLSGGTQQPQDTPLVENQPVGPAWADITTNNFRQLEGTQGPVGPFKRLAKFFSDLDPRAAARAAAIFAASFTNPQVAVQSVRDFEGRKHEEEMARLQGEYGVKEAQERYKTSVGSRSQTQFANVSRDLQKLGLLGKQINGQTIEDPLLYEDPEEAARVAAIARQAISEHNAITQELKTERERVIGMLRVKAPHYKALQRQFAEVKTIIDNLLKNPFYEDIPQIRQGLDSWANVRQALGAIETRMLSDEKYDPSADLQKISEAMVQIYGGEEVGGDILQQGQPAQTGGITQGSATRSLFGGGNQMFEIAE